MATIEEAVRKPAILKTLDHCRYLQTLAAFHAMNQCWKRCGTETTSTSEHIFGVGIQDGEEPQFYKYEQLGRLARQHGFYRPNRDNASGTRLLEASRQDGCIGLEIRCSPAELYQMRAF
jgi:hypothetical protein